jgi:hypothetical protein
MTLEQFQAALEALDEKQLAQMIERRHPFYALLTPHWNFLEATYDGGREWFDENLFKFHKEGVVEFEDRQKRAYRPNHTREVVDLVNKYIFKATIARKVDDAPDHVKAFWTNATMHRRDVTDFMRLVSQKSSVFGKIWVVMDSIAPAEGATIADQKSGAARVYGYIVKPQNALDMAFDATGALEWIMIQESFRDDELFGGSGTVQPRYRLWTQNHWALFAEGKRRGSKRRYEIVAVGEHNLGAVPVFAVDHVIAEDQYWATGLIDDVAYLDRAVANYLSNLDAIIQDQTFSQLVIPAQAIMPDDEGDAKILEMGTKRMFTYDAQAGVAPQFISPDPRQATLILSVINKIISEIYHTVGMSGERTKEDNSMGIDNSSGVAKAYDFERMNAMLASKAQSLQVAENKMVAFTRLYNTDGDPTSVFEDEDSKLVSYPGNFDVRSLYDEFEIASQLALLAAPDKVRQEQMKLLIDKLFPGLADKLIKELKASVTDDWPAEPPLPTMGGTTPPVPAAKSKQGQNNKDPKEAPAKPRD